MKQKGIPFKDREFVPPDRVGTSFLAFIGVVAIVTTLAVAAFSTAEGWLIDGIKQGLVGGGFWTIGTYAGVRMAERGKRD